MYIETSFYGVATFCKQQYTPVSVQEGITTLVDDHEFNLTAAEKMELNEQARCIITDHGAFVLLNVYCPTAYPRQKEDETNENIQKFHSQILFHKTMQKKCESLIHNGRKVVVVGDINVARHKIDSFNPDPVRVDEDGILVKVNTVEFDDLPARIWFNSWLSQGSIIDTFRYFYPHVQSFTRWRRDRRIDNLGTRLDYILTCSSMLPFVRDTTHLQEIQGSDHCPVLCSFDEYDPKTGQKLLIETTSPPPMGCTCYWPQFSLDASHQQLTVKKKPVKVLVVQKQVNVESSVVLLKVDKHKAIRKQLKRNGFGIKISTTTKPSTLAAFLKNNSNSF